MSPPPGEGGWTGRRRGVPGQSPTSVRRAFPGWQRGAVRDTLFPQQTGAAASSARGSSAQHLGRRGTRGLSHVTLRRRYPGGTSAMKNRSPRATTRRLCTRVVWWRSSREARHQLPRSATHSSRLRSPTRTREAETGEARYGRGVTRKVLAKGFPPYQPLQLRNYVRNINHFVFQCTLKLIIPDLRGLCCLLYTSDAADE